MTHASRGDAPDLPHAASTRGRRSADEASPAVLRRVAAELASLHARVVGLQDLLGPALAAAADADRAVMAAGQDLDAVAQSLDGLSTFIAAFERGGQGLDRFDAVGAAALVKLGGLSSRLADLAASDQDGTVHGDLDLF